MSDIRDIDIRSTAHSVDLDDAIAVAYQEGRPDDKAARGSNHLFTFILMGMFFLVMMVCLVAGVSIYRSVAALHDEANTMHMESGLLVNVVRMNDMADAVQITDGPEGDALVLVSHLDSGTFETRIYTYEGAIVQEYAIAGRDLNPEGALQIVESDTFEFSYENGLLTLVTDNGSYDVAIRSAQSAGVPVASSGFAAAGGEQQ
jgi:hypothetical protein